MSCHSHYLSWPCSWSLCHTIFHWLISPSLRKPLCEHIMTWPGYMLAIVNARSLLRRTVPYILNSRVTPIRIFSFWKTAGAILFLALIRVTQISRSIVWCVFLGNYLWCSRNSTNCSSLPSSSDTISNRAWYSLGHVTLGFCDR